MNKYKILYVDESKVDRDEFQLHMYLHGESKFDVQAWHPDSDIEEFVEKILDNEFDAIVTDYVLYEGDSRIGYDGEELVAKIMEYKLDFPCFILTSYEDDAVKKSDLINVHFIYLKGGELKQEVATHEISFAERIEYQILHYRKKIDKASKELRTLSSKEDKDANDEARILELEAYIEKTMDARNAIPRQLKIGENLAKLHQLISNTDHILEKLGINRD